MSERCETADRTKQVLQTLLYFEIFTHPLRAEEVQQFCSGESCQLSEIRQQLDELVSEGEVFRFGDYYQTHNDPSWVARRLEYNQRADVFLPVAHKMARFIGAFPFIRAVMVSGSLSKHSMSADSDIDFFMITRPGRLWLARTLLVLFKKIVLFNSHKYFCVNYFVDAEHLEIEEKNIFTATETVTLLPLYGREWCEAFQQANQWAYRQLPNYPVRPLEQVAPAGKPLPKRISEWMLSGFLGAGLDSGAMRLTVAYWRRKFRHFDARTFDSAIKSRRYVSKHHPLYFQKKVLERLERLCRERGV